MDNIMKIIRRFLRSRQSNGQAGQALILVLMFLAMGSLTLVPTLSHISTALKTGEIYEENTNELYTADAGIEDGLWRIKYDYMGPDYDAYDFVSAFPYQTEDLNGMPANFTIMNVWFATDFNLADTDAPEYIEPDEVRGMMESQKLVVAGSALPEQPYRIMIDFNPGAGDNLTIKSLGVWLPKGFSYVGPCSLDDGDPFTHPVWEPDDITVDPEAPGGSTVLWSYDDGEYPYLEDFPEYNPVDNTFVVTFGYAPPLDHPSWLPAAVAWVTTEMHDAYGNTKPNDVPVSWDIDTRYFKMVSAANDTSVEAYTSKNDLRQMGDAMAGDYVAIGNALLKDDDGDHVRDDWHTPSSFTLDSIPENAEAVYAYLYWTGWIEENDIEDVFYDNCSDFDAWDRSTSPTDQSRVPTAEGINSGTWTTSPYWSKVDETSPDDNDYITGTTGNQVRIPTGDDMYSGTWSSSPYWSKVDETTPNDTDYITGTSNSGGYRLFNFSNFTVPSGSTIDSLTVYFRARDVSGTNPNNNLRASIYVHGTRYDASSSVDPTAGWTTYSYSWNENPETGDPWTRQEINGGSSYPLERFGIRSTDFAPDIRVSMVYAQVNYSGGGYRLFDFSDFTVPANSEVENLTVYYRVKDASGTNPNNNLRASIRVDGNRYDASSSVDPTASWTTYSYTFNENPDTGDPWTWQEINGGSSDPLQQFGVYSTDLSPYIQISMVYATVTYFESRWTIQDDSNDNFKGQGSTSADPEAKILTLKDSLNLSTAGVYSISWDQDEGGNLSYEDIFSFAFSGDGGDTWSPYYVAFYGNDPASPFSYPVPDEYKTNDFKIRFYFNFNAASEYVYMDNIEITYLPVDMDVVFKINDQQVYLDGDNQPQIGLQKITADRSYAMRNTLSGPHGFSYACVRDVSALVKAFPVVPGEEHHTGNAKYTVSDVTADTRNSEIQFAGWSLIVIYASPESAGHYIYIRDENFYSHTSGDTDPLDFDADGVPGGLITGFKIPDPITDKYGQITETVAAKLTCFIVEGDSWYTGDYLEITGQGSGTSKNLSNSGSPWNNVWNNASYPGNYQGQDIDTFVVNWDDGILTPGDNNLQVDLTSNVDAWNLVYFIISVRSETVTSGTSHYTIHGG